MTVDGASTLTGAVTISGGSFTASAQTTLGAGLSNDGTLDIDAAVLGGQTLTNTETATIGANITGSFEQNSDATATTTVDGAANVSGGLDIDTGTLTVDAALTGDVDVAAGASYDQNDGLTGTLTTAGGADIDGDITGNLISSGTTTLAGDVSGTVAQSAGSVTVDGNSTVSGAIDLDSGTMSILANQELTAASLDAAAGAAVSVGDNAVLNLTSNSLNNAGAITVGNGGLVDDAGAITNTTTGDIFFQQAGTLDAGGNLINAGDIAFGTVIAGVADINVGGAADNDGTLTLNGGGTIDVVGTLDNSSTVDLDGITDVTVGTDLTNTGEIDFSTSGTLNVGNDLINSDEIVFGGAADIDVGGTVDNDAALTLNGGGTIDIVGALDNSGTISLNDGGAVEVALTVTNQANSSITFGGSGSFNAGGAAASTIANTGAIVVAAGGGNTVTFGGGGTNDNVDNLTAAPDNGTITVNSGTLTGIGVLNNTSTSATAISVAAGAELDVDSLTSSAGTVVIDGTLEGAVTLNTGTILDLNVGGEVVGNVTVNDTSTVDLVGQIDGNITLEDDATLDLNGGTITGNLVNNSSIAVALAGNINGDFAQTPGTSTNIDGATSIGGELGNQNASLIIEDTGVLTFGSLNNTGGTILLQNGSTIGGTSFVNAGTIETSVVASNGATELDPNPPNAAITSSAVTISSNFTNSGVFDMQQLDGQEVRDVVTINGDAVLNGTILFDVNVSGGDIDDFVEAGAGTALADQIIVTGDLSGDVTLELQNVDNVDNTQASLGTNIDLVTYGTNSGTDVTVSGLNTNGAFVYRVMDSGNALQLESIANPALGGLASGVAATQGLISTVVNRPSAALVTPLVDPGDEPCAIGTWGRMSGGRAEATLASNTAVLSTTNDMEMSYKGIQLGLDQSCTYGGEAADVAYGAIFGYNQGQTNLPVYEYDANGGTINTTVVTSNVDNSFEQTFGGAYISAGQGNLFGDIMLRADRTKYDVSEDKDFANGGLGLEDQSYESRGTTLSGSLSYSTILSEEHAIRFVPSIGFSVSRIEADDIVLERDPGTVTDDSTLQIADINQRIGLIGGTVARTQVLKGNRSAVTYFATATYFKDFGDEISANLVSNSAAENITSDNLGAFGEFSMGLNYTDLLGEGRQVPGRQLDASIRVDSRFSSRVDSWGMTAQVRWQF